MLTDDEESDGDGHGEVEVSDGLADHPPHQGVLVHEDLQQGGHARQPQEAH